MAAKYILLGIVIILCCIIEIPLIKLDHDLKKQDKEEEKRFKKEYNQKLADNKEEILYNLIPFSQRINDLWKYKVYVKRDFTDFKINIIVYPKCERVPKVIISDDPNYLIIDGYEENNLMYNCKLDVEKGNYDFLKDLCKDSFRPAEIIFEL